MYAWLADIFVTDLSFQKHCKLKINEGKGWDNDSSLTHFPYLRIIRQLPAASSHLQYLSSSNKLSWSLVIQWQATWHMTYDFFCLSFLYNSLTNNDKIVFPKNNHYSIHVISSSFSSMTKNHGWVNKYTFVSPCIGKGHLH